MAGNNARHCLCLIHASQLFLFAYSVFLHYLCSRIMSRRLYMGLWQVAMLVAALWLCSCVTSKKVNYMQEPDKHIPSYSDTLLYTDYVLQTDDRLYIQVYSIDEKISALFNAGVNATYVRQWARSNSANSNSDLYTYTVDKDGNINFPTLGLVQVRGLDTREVKLLLEERLAGLIVQQGSMPNLAVEVQVVGRTFSIIGMKSGRYTLPKEKVTIFEALAMAGDIADFGDRSEIKIVREEHDSTVIKTFDVRSKDIINSEFYYVEPNDVIYIRKMRGYSFGINSAATAISVTAGTISFGLFIYTLVDRFIVKPVQRSQQK